MPEREQDLQSVATPFWTHDEQIGEGTFGREACTIRLQAHLGDESYRHSRFSRAPHEIVPLQHTTGTRTYVLTRPYLLEPEFSLTVGVFPRRRGDGAIGQVSASSWEGMRHRLIGKAQAWFYKEDRTFILWEYFLDRRHAGAARDDPNLHALWYGFEAFLLRHFPDSAQIATPSWEPLYDREIWQAFLGSRGYTKLNEGAFGKQIDQQLDHATREDAPV